MNNKILVTGASSGVGASIANYLSKEYEVIVVARRLEKLKAIFSKNEKVSIYQMDLSNVSGVEEVMDNIIAENGNIPYLINNAGTMHSSMIENLDKEDLLYSLNVNAIAPMMILKKLLPNMKKHQFGRIINITSGAPLNCIEKFAAYSSSKAALNALTVTAAKENEHYNIKINLMSPGPCKTEMAPDGPMDPSVCHPTVDYLLNLDEGGPTGQFFWLGYEVPLFPDLEGVKWLEGIGNEKLRRVL